MIATVTPNLTPTGSHLSRLARAIEVVEQAIGVSLIVVKPKVGDPGVFDFNITFADARHWNQDLKDISGAWSMKTVQMDFLTNIEVIPFRDLREAVTACLSLGITNIKVEW